MFCLNETDVCVEKGMKSPDWLQKLLNKKKEEVKMEEKEEFELIPIEEILELSADDWKWELMAEIWLLLDDLSSDESIICYCSRVILSDYLLLQQGTHGQLMRKKVKRITFQGQGQEEDEEKSTSTSNSYTSKGGFDPQEGVFHLKLDNRHLKNGKKLKKKAKSVAYYRYVVLIND